VQLLSQYRCQIDARIFHPVDARGFNVDGGKTSAGKLGTMLLLCQDSGDTADPQFDVAANLLRDLATHDNVRNRKAPAWPKRAKGFS